MLLIKYMNFSKKGRLVNYSLEEKKIKIKLENVLNGINTFPDFFIKKENGKIIYIIDRTCDHNGGKLIHKEKLAICPQHGWELNLNSLKYNQSIDCKKKIEFTVNENNEIEFFIKNYVLLESFINEIEKK